MHYRALTDLRFYDKIVEAGQVTDTIPDISVPWLLAQGHIEQVAAPDPAPRRRKGRS